MSQSDPESSPLSRRLFMRAAAATPLLVGCVSESLRDAATGDAGGNDAGANDSGSTDGGSTNDGGSDSGGTDAGSTDGDTADDAGTSDAGSDSATGDAGTYGPPDICPNASFETGYDGFTNWSGGTPTGVIRSMDRAFHGLYSVRSEYRPTSTGYSQQFWKTLPRTLDEIFVRFYYYLEGDNPDISHKWSRVYSGPGVNVGLYSMSNRSQRVACAFSTAGNTNVDIGIGRMPAGAWHSVEWQAQRMGGGMGGLRARFWFDGAPTIGSGTSGSTYWDGPWLDSGVADTGFGPFDRVAFDDQINGGNTRSGLIYYDRIAVSTRRLGP